MITYFYALFCMGTIDKIHVLFYESQFGITKNIRSIVRMDMLFVQAFNTY